MPAFKSKIGLRFGSLVAVSTESRNGRYWYFCDCDCGQSLWVAGGNLHSERGTQSCGCSKDGNPTHGLSKTPEFAIWKGMRKRCNNPNDPTYKHYGARGIKVCKRWDKFENFLADMGKRPSPKHSIERKKVNKGYSPSNCIWLLRKHQAWNRRDTVYVTYKGVKKSLREWSKELGIDFAILRARYYRKMPVERMLCSERLHKSRRKT